MSVLIEGLPRDALCKQDKPGEAPWGIQEELLAQIVEEVSVLASDRRRTEPRVLERPYETSGSSKSGISGTPDTGMSARGAAGMIAMSQVYLGEGRVNPDA